MRTTYTQY